MPTTSPPPPLPPVLIVGAPRSGTSLVYRALCLHPDAAWISGWLRRAPGWPVLAVANRIPVRFPERRAAAWFPGGNAYAYGARRRITERVLPQPSEGEPVFRRAGLGLGPHGTVAGGGSTRLADTFASLRRWSGAPVVVSKRIDHNRRVAALEAALAATPPHWIHVTRDPHAAVASLADVDWWANERLWWWDERTPTDWVAQGGDPWEVCTRHWCAEEHAARSGLADVPAGRVHHLTYEDLVADLPGTLRALAGAVGLDDDPAWCRQLDGLRTPSGRERWRARLGPDGLATVDATLAAHHPDRQAGGADTAPTA